MKSQRCVLCRLNKINHWLTLLALLLLSIIPTPSIVAAAPIAPSSQSSQNQHIEPGQIPAGLSADDWLSIQAQIEPGSYLKASNKDNAEAHDYFGVSVAVSDDTVVVGAYGEDSNATGVNGNQADNSVESGGAAYVFVRNGSGWSQQAYLKASNTGADDRFGWSVAISGDTVVVGARHEDSNATGVNGSQTNNTAADAGAAYVFVRSGSTWSQQAYLKASNTGADDEFGFSVSAFGDTVVVGAPYEDSNTTGVNGNQADNSAESAGAAYVFVRSGSTWSQQAYLKASNTGAYDYFGSSLSIVDDTLAVGAYGEDSNATGVNGNQTDNSADDAGAAYIFLRNSGAWSQQAYLKASNTGEGDQFGWNVSISGDTLVIGAISEDSSATGVNGSQTDNSASGAGAAYVFVRSGSTWSQQAYLKASNTESNDFFGVSVSISDDTVAIGAIGEDSSVTGVNGDESDNSADTAGAVYIFTHSGSTWSQQSYIKASNTGTDDWFGWSVSTYGDTVVIGARNEDSNGAGVNGDQFNNTAAESGAAYVLVRSDSTWSQQAYLKTSNTAAGDQFGFSVAISNNTVVVGAPYEDSRANGVDGEQADNSAPEAGAAYIFVRNSGAWVQQAYLKASNTEENDQFGRSVAISGDTVVIGVPYEDSSATGVNGNQTDNSADGAGAVYVFVRDGSTWSQQAYLKASNTEADDWFGWNVSISGDTVVVGAWGEDSNATTVNGNQIDNSADSAGAAYVFVRSGSTWSQQAYLKASNSGAGDQFGWSASISGDTVAVGAASEDSSATGVNGNQADNTATDSGAAYIFIRTGSDWSQQAYLKASNAETGDIFGASTAVSDHTVVVGACGEKSSATGVNGNQADNSADWAGAAYVFVANSGNWSQQAYLKASNTGEGDWFGWNVSISGDTAVVGAYGEASSATGVNGNQADNSALNAGAAYVFVRSGDNWSHQAYLKASNTEAGDYFGRGVSVSNNKVVVGAWGEDGNATSVNGNQADNSAPDIGAAYLFTSQIMAYLPIVLNNTP